MNNSKKPVRILEGVRPDQIPFDTLFEANEPVILRGLVSDWGLVQAGKVSPGNAMDVLQSHSSGQPVGVYIAPPESNARFFYNDDCSGFNYASQHLELRVVFSEIRDNEINPNHPNLTIWHNKIDACIFVGVHCHQANLALKIIRGGTNCYTMAMCAQAGHEDACLSFRDASAEKIKKLTEAVKKLKSQGVKSQAVEFTQFKMDRNGLVVSPAVIEEYENASR